MSAEYKFENHTQEMRQQSKVKLTDLLSRINSKKSYGGTSFENVKKMIKKAKNE